MANQSDASEVNTEYEKVELEPEEITADDEMLGSEEKETPSDSSQDEKPAADSDDEGSKPDGEEEPEKKEEVRGRGAVATEPKIEDQKPEPKPVPGETPRERALRLEVERLKAARRKDQAKELLGDTKTPAPESNQLSTEKLEVLKRYDSEELKNLEEVVDVLAEKKGWVRKGDLQKENYNTVANDQLESFLAEHTEYLPENDTDNTLWESFKSEFALYKQPENPKEFKRIFNKIHKEIFGIQPQQNLKKIDAAKEKIKVASHVGASTGGSGGSRKGTSQLDPSLKGNLKGFTDDELNELFG